MPTILDEIAPMTEATGEFAPSKQTLHSTRAAPFGHFISIGPNCATAQLLKTGDLRRYSSPFDWLFANPRIVAEAIRDDFASFTQRSLWIRSGSPTEWTQQRWLVEYGSNVVIAHHDLTNDANYAYFMRCVQRFRSIFSSSMRIALVILAPSDQINHPHFGELFDVISKHAINCHVIVLGWRTGYPQQRFKMVRRTPTLDQYEIDTYSPVSNGLQFADDSDSRMIHALLRRYPIDLANDPLKV